MDRVKAQRPLVPSQFWCENSSTKTRAARLLWGVLCLVWVVACTVAVHQIASDAYGVVSGVMTAVVSLAVARPLITNILWALHVIFVLPAKALLWITDRLEDTTMENQRGQPY